MSCECEVIAFLGLGRGRFPLAAESLGETINRGCDKAKVAESPRSCACVPHTSTLEAVTAGSAIG